MTRVTRISIAVVFALGTSAAIAQTVQRGATQQGAAAATRAPVQVAQAGAAAGAGGASAGASTAAAVGGVGVAGTVASTVVFVGSAVASVAGAANGSTPPTSH